MVVAGCQAAGLTLNESGSVPWAPTLGDVGTHEIALEVSASDGQVFPHVFLVSVLPASTEVIFTSAPGTLATTSQPYQYQATATHNGAAVPVKAELLPQGMDCSLSGLLSWTPRNTQAGRHRVTLREESGESVARQTFEIVVQAAGSDQIVAELAPGGQATARFVYGERGNVPALMVTASQVYRIVSDHRGSVRLVVNTNTGEVVQRMDYDEFGRVLSDTNPGFQPFGFAGGLYDADTGLVRFGARDYDAHTGRWTARDPIFFRGRQANLYVYVNQDPVNFVDPNGLLNPGKLAASAISYASAGRLYGTGILRLGAAAGLEGTGFQGPGYVLAALGAWNLKSACAAQDAGKLLAEEALAGEWEEARPQDLLGPLPFGTEYDDADVPTPWEFVRDRASQLLEKPVELITELGKWL